MRSRVPLGSRPCRRRRVISDSDSRVISDSDSRVISDSGRHHGRRAAAVLTGSRHVGRAVAAALLCAALTWLMLETVIPPAPGTKGSTWSSAVLPDTAYPIPAGAVFASPNGDDQASGGRTEPLRTLGAALNRVPSG